MSVGKTVVSEMRQLAAERPEQAAYVFYDKDGHRTAYTRQHTWDLCLRFASVLHGAGVQQGDIVCNTLPNSPERIITQLGTMVAGAASMQGQLLMSDGSDLSAALIRSKSKAIIVETNSKVHNFLTSLEFKNGNGERNYQGVPDLRLVIAIDFQRELDADSCPMPVYFMHLLNTQETYTADVEPSDTCVVFTTSGSTGFSKLVPQPHSRVLEITKVFSKVLTLQDGDVYYCDRLLGWSAGFPYFSTSHGCTRVLLDFSQGLPSNEGHLMWETVCKEGCTSAYMTPVQIERIIKDEMNWKSSKNSGGHKLKTIGMGGGPLTQYQMDAIGKITEGVSTSYGASECCSIAYFIVKDKDSYENCCNGWPTEGVEVKIVDERLKELPQGEFGEILCRSQQTATHYLNDADSSSETFLADGWVRLGDLGYLNQKGQLFVFCRKSFAIHMGTYVVYPGWIENKIKQCPGIQAIALVGVPHQSKHEELCACVIRQPGNEITDHDVHEFCKGLFLSPEGNEMTPLPKHYLFLDDFPRNANGKLERKKLREQACQVLGLAI